MAFISHPSKLMDSTRSFPQSPLTLEDIKKIEETGLPSLERHHLRLLAHCLQCFKEMAKNVATGSLPQEQDRLRWCSEQPSLVNDQAFISVLLEQFSAAGSQLEKIANMISTSPLELTLDDLIKVSLSSLRESE